jgi:hypothetical protein
MCKQRGKTWEGADPQCAFENGIFSSENWNCATADEALSKLMLVRSGKVIESANSYSPNNRMEEIKAKELIGCQV